MGIFTAIEAMLKLGLPLVGLSWMIFHSLFSEGKIERDARQKIIHGDLKKMKRAFKNSENKKARFIYDKWAVFGGGFYGLAGLWTFFAIEANDFLRFIVAGNYFSYFSEGLINFVVQFLTNQLGNAIQALLWFAYWPGAGQSMLIWIAVGYLGYWGGLEAARRQLSFADITRLKRPADISQQKETIDNENN